MAPSYVVKTSCRLCGSTDLSLAVKLEATPLANDFRLDRAEAGNLELIPLEVLMCGACGHFQLSVVVEPEELFSDYLYSTGTSSSFRNHFGDLAVSAARLVGDPGRLAVDIGSNDGTLLAALRTQGFRPVGVEPSRNHVSASRDAGLQIVEGFLSDASVARILDRYGGASLVTANNVFAHIDDLQGAFSLVRDLLLPGGYLLFEVSYFMDVMERTLFDTIYHEHLDYHTVKPLIWALAQQEMQLVDLQRVDTHGGSIRVIARKGSGFEVEGRLIEAIAHEERIFADPYRAIRMFTHAIDNSRSRFWEQLNATSEGRPVAGYSAPAKATTLIHQYGLTSGDLAWVVDDNPLKQGRYMPGIGSPIVSSQQLDSAPSDMALVVFAWNLANELAERATRDHGWKGPIVNPAPISEDWNVG